MAACQGLTELTLIYPHPDDTLVAETGLPLDKVGVTHSAALELVNACKALPDFNTIQLVHFLGRDHTLPAMCEYERMRDGNLSSAEQPRQVLRDRVEVVRDLVIDCLRNPEMGSQEGEETRKTTLRVIELGKYRLPGKPYHRVSVRVEKVEEYEVREFDDKNP